MKVSLLAGLIIGVAVAMLVLYTAPPIEDFNPLNPYWNGFSDLMSKFHAVELKSLLDENLFLDPSNTSLLIVGPEKEFSEDEAKIIKRFLKSGGQVILADDFGSGNQLLELLEVDVRFNGSLLVDPLFKERSMRLPRIRAMVLGVRELVFNYGTVLEGCPSPIAESSSYSFLDLDLNGEWSEGEPRGSFAAACSLSLGKGRLIIVADSSLWVNSMLQMRDNRKFLESLTGGRAVLIDESHWKPSSLTIAKRMLNISFSYITSPELRYALIALIIVALVRYRRRHRRAEEDEGEKVLMRNPTWDKGLLIKLEREMRGER